MNIKRNLFITILFVNIAIFASWTQPEFVMNSKYADIYLSPSNVPVFVCDTAGNMFLTTYDLTRDAYFSISSTYYDGSNWAYPGRIDDSHTGGIYAMSMLPTLSIEPNGERMYIWEDFNSGMFELNAKYDDNSALSSQMVITNSGELTFSPKSLYKNGKHHVIYRDNISKIFNLYYAYYDSAWSTPQCIYSSLNNCIDHSFYVFDDNSISIIFTELDEGYFNMYNIRKDSVWSSPIPVYKGYSDIFSPFLIADNNYEIAIFIMPLNGLLQLFISKYIGNTWTSPILLSENNYNISSPTALIKNDTLHIFYISDEFTHGVVYDLKYDLINSQIIDREKIIDRRKGELFTLHSLLTPDGNINIAFMCNDGDSAGYTYENSIYWTHTTGTKSKSNMKKPYKIQYSSNGIMLEAQSNIQKILILDKVGRKKMEINNLNTNKYYLDSNIFKTNDIYFIYFISENKKYSEKILWLK